MKKERFFYDSYTNTTTCMEIMNLKEARTLIKDCETNETLRIQHHIERERIDKIIEEENKAKKSYRYEDTVDYAIEQFLKMVDE